MSEEAKPQRKQAPETEATDDGPSKREQALAAKKRGNAAYAVQDWKKAIEEFTDAIALDPTDHVFYSNRSGCHANLGDYETALKDARTCVEKKPDWAKGYSRVGLALYQMGKYYEAKDEYEKGLKIDPNNATLKEGVSQANRVLQQQQADLMAKMEEIKKRMEATKKKESGSKPKPMEDDTSDDSAEEVEMVDPTKPAKEEKKKEEVEKTEEELAEEAEKKKKEEEEQKKKKDKEQALAEKMKGNELYKKKQFDEALLHYDKAIELDPTEAIYLLNKAAVVSMKKEYQESIEICKKALIVGRKNGAEFKTIAKAHSRIGNAQKALGKLDEAIRSYEESLLEKRDDKVKRLLKAAEVLKKKKDAEAYWDDEKSNQAKSRGNAKFKEQKWVEAIEEYEEAIKRNPKNHFAFSNRAACYMKLMDWQRGLDDCNTCIKLKPDFLKAYTRKGRTQHFLKQYHKALETYDEALKIDADNEEIKQDRYKTQMAIQQESASGNVDPQRAREAMKDPEIQQILGDQVIGDLLNRAQKGDNEALSNGMKDPEIRRKIMKLINAGLLGTGPPKQ